MLKPRVKLLTAALFCTLFLVYFLRSDHAFTQSSAEFNAETETCKSCHAEQHLSWTDSLHAKAIVPIELAEIKADFSTAPLISERMTAEFSAQNGFSMTVNGVVYKPVAVVGSRRIQLFLARDGEDLIKIPAAWDVGKKIWFELNAESKLPGDDDDSVLLKPWRADCASCHSTASDRRNFTNSIVCASCHGDLQPHLETVSSFTFRVKHFFGFAAEVNAANPEKLGADRKNLICAQCHAKDAHAEIPKLNDVLKPAENYRSSIDLSEKVDSLTGSSEAIALASSLCAIRSKSSGDRADSRKIDCGSCHQLHGKTDDFLMRKELAGNAVCTQCHLQFGERDALVLHTNHAADGGGSSCVECHMPKNVPAFRSLQRSHEISVTLKACEQCHTDRASDFIKNGVRKFWGETNFTRFSKEKF